MPIMSIFVNHSHHDAPFCHKLVRALRDAGADVWYDEHNLASGQLLDVVQHELDQHSVFIVILSRPSSPLVGSIARPSGLTSSLIASPPASSCPSRPSRLTLMLSLALNPVGSPSTISSASKLLALLTPRHSLAPCSTASSATRKLSPPSTTPSPSIPT